MDSISNFIHSQDFWKWHGFVLSALWLFGSSLGIYLKKKGVIYHLLTFIIVDYVSLFFMGAAIYLVLPNLPNFFKWGFLLRLHVFAGIIFLVLMTIQHIGGAVSWHKSTRNYGHRKLGTRLVIMGRILAGVGWLIHQQNKIYSIVVVLVSLFIYVLAERGSWSKIKTS